MSIYNQKFRDAGPEQSLVLFHAKCYNFFPIRILLSFFAQLVKQEHVINATRDMPLQNQLFPLFKYTINVHA